MAEQRTFQGHVYTQSAPGQPWVLAGPTTGPQPVTVGTAHPKDPPSGFRWVGGQLEVIPGGPADKASTQPTPPTGYRYKGDGSLEPIPGGPQDAGSTKIPGDPTKQGPEYLATLPQNVRSRVQQMLDGRTMLTQREKGQPFGQMLMDAANQADPNFDEAASHARYAARLQFTGQGKGSQIVQAADRFASHVNDLYNASNNLVGPDLGFDMLSNAATSIGQRFDQKHVATYNQILPFISGEVQKLVKNGAATEGDGNKIMDGLRVGQPRDVRNAAIAELVSLGRAQMQPQRDAWEAAWSGSVAPPMPMDFAPSTHAIFDAIENGQPGLTRKQDKDGRDHWFYADGSPIGGAGGTTGSPPGAPPGAPGTPGTPGGAPPVTPWDLDGPAARGFADSGTQLVDNPQMRAIVASMVNAHASMADINSTLAKHNLPPVKPAEFQAVQKWMNQNPGKAYPTNAVHALHPENLTLMQQAVDSPWTAFGVQGVNAFDAGIPGKLTGDRGKGTLEAMSAASPVASALGEVGGSVAGTFALGAGATRLAAKVADPTIAALLANPHLANAAFGTISGATGGRQSRGRRRSRADHEPWRRLSRQQAREDRAGPVRPEAAPGRPQRRRARGLRRRQQDGHSDGAGRA
jgi:hypothetical protein